MNAITFLNIVNDIAAELDLAEEIFPLFPKGPIHAAGIVGEEAGKLQQAALQFTYEGGSLSDMKTEAIQTAAMAIRFLANILNMEARPSVQL
jgi:hypothetical protein